MKKTKNKTIAIFMKALNIAIIATLLLLLAFNLFNIISRYAFKNDLPKVFGITNAIVVSGSMRDIIEPGDLIIIKEKNEYKVGDIITFRKDNVIITHRLIEKTETGYITQGDANNTADPEISYEQIEGKVIQIIPKIGIYIEFLKTPLGMLIILAATVFILTLRSVVDKRNIRKSENEEQR